MSNTNDNGTGQGSAVVLATLNDAAQLVAKYAARLISDERAQQFYSQLSLMAKQEPKIAMCTPQSVLTAMMACVHLDLMPNTPEQHAFVIPYNNKGRGVMELQFQPGYKGLLVLAQRSGQVRKIEAQLVFKGDKFNYDLGIKPKLTHKPSLEVDRTKYELVTAAYVVITLSNGEVVFDVMGRPELDKVQNTSKASSTDTPWKKWPEAMAKKTIVKRGLKLIPSDTKDNRLEYAAIYDSWAEAGKLGVNASTGKLEQVAAAEAAKEADVQAKAKSILDNLGNGETIEGDDPHRPAEAPAEDKPAKPAKPAKVAKTDETKPPQPNVKERAAKWAADGKAANAKKAAVEGEVVTDEPAAPSN